MSFCSTENCEDSYLLFDQFITMTLKTISETLNAPKTESGNGKCGQDYKQTRQ